mmetsp:Transcript_17249/g.47835  ORF Transcript_17249/g.47835 Transcript_17249/m.47835 type:complete len:221 (-) Transcript_17249:310-972(-)
MHKYLVPQAAVGCTTSIPTQPCRSWCTEATTRSCCCCWLCCCCCGCLLCCTSRDRALRADCCSCPRNWRKSWWCVLPLPPQLLLPPLPHKSSPLKSLPKSTSALCCPHSSVLFSRLSAAGSASSSNQTPKVVRRNSEMPTKRLGRGGRPGGKDCRAVPSPDGLWTRCCPSPEAATGCCCSSWCACCESVCCCWAPAVPSPGHVAGWCRPPSLDTCCGRRC